MAAHDHEGSSDRSFGLVFTAVFVLVALSPLRHHLPARWWALAAAAFMLCLALGAPATLGPANRIWTRFSRLVQAVTNPVIMAILFYGLITPVALVLKLVGKDSMKRGFEPDAKTYWTSRGPAENYSETMQRQF